MLIKEEYRFIKEIINPYVDLASLEIGIENERTMASLEISINSQNNKDIDSLASQKNTTENENKSGSEQASRKDLEITSVLKFNNNEEGIRFVVPENVLYDLLRLREKRLLAHLFYDVNINEGVRVRDNTFCLNLKKIRAFRADICLIGNRDHVLSFVIEGKDRNLIEGDILLYLNRYEQDRGFPNINDSNKVIEVPEKLISSIEKTIVKTENIKPLHI